MTAHRNFTRTQENWDAVARGDFTKGIEDLAAHVVVENGPGAGPWRHLDGKEAFFTFAMQFVQLFGGTWTQEGTCIYADDDVAVALVHETGNARSGARFDNRALWITRFGVDDKVDRLWTVDLDTEAVEAFWQSNPAPPAMSERDGTCIPADDAGAARRIATPSE